MSIDIKRFENEITKLSVDALRVCRNLYNSNKENGYINVIDREIENRNCGINEKIKANALNKSTECANEMYNIVYKFLKNIYLNLSNIREKEPFEFEKNNKNKTQALKEFCKIIGKDYSINTFTELLNSENRDKYIKIIRECFTKVFEYICTEDKDVVKIIKIVEKGETKFRVNYTTLSWNGVVELISLPTKIENMKQRQIRETTSINEFVEGIRSGRIYTDGTIDFSKKRGKVNII